MSLDARTPAGGDIVLVRPFGTLPEFVLELRTHEETFDTYRGGDGDTEALVLAPALRDDLDDTVTSTGAVESGCRSPLEDGHALDIVGIDVREAVPHVG